MLGFTCDGDEENAFEKLLAHEMAHRLHIRILNGNENAMGQYGSMKGLRFLQQVNLRKKLHS